MLFSLQAVITKVPFKIYYKFVSFVHQAMSIFFLHYHLKSCKVKLKNSNKKADANLVLFFKDDSEWSNKQVNVVPSAL